MSTPNNAPMVNMQDPFIALCYSKLSVQDRQALDQATPIVANLKLVDGNFPPADQVTLQQFVALNVVKQFLAECKKLKTQMSPPVTR
jgi:hypothetical protein